MPKKIVFRRPLLSGLGSRLSDSRKLAVLRQNLRRQFPKVDRVAIALYDPKTGTAKTFLSHGDRPTPLVRCEARLKEAASLGRVFRSRRVRVVNDMDLFAGGSGLHTRALRAGWFHSSATFPVVIQNRVEGFVFFNSRRRNAFAPGDLPLLEIFALLVAGVATAGVRSVGLLRAALKTASGMVHLRDPETGNHLERMARYSRVIAQELARTGRHRFSDERVHDIESFAPLRDVGKIGIPDRILLKPEPLTGAERRLMRTHTTKGRRIVDSILRNFGLTSLARSDALRNIAERHTRPWTGPATRTVSGGRKSPSKPASWPWRTSSTPSRAPGPTRRPGRWTASSPPWIV